MTNVVQNYLFVKQTLNRSSISPMIMDINPHLHLRLIYPAFTHRLLTWLLDYARVKPNF